jgi:hypothetical protein
MLFPLLSFFTVAAHAANSSPEKSTACSCSSGFVPIPVDVTIPVDPSNPEGLNSTDTFRLQTTFEVYGVLCEPVSADSQYSSQSDHLIAVRIQSSQKWTHRCHPVALTWPDIHHAVLGRDLGRVTKLLIRRALMQKRHFFLRVRQHWRRKDQVRTVNRYSNAHRWKRILITRPGPQERKDQQHPHRHGEEVSKSRRVRALPWLSDIELCRHWRRSTLSV